MSYSSTSVSGEQSNSKSQQIIVIMPCYNEEGRVGKVVSAVKEIIPDATILVIDDASTDNSAQEAEKAGAMTLRHACNLGYGAALELCRLPSMPPRLRASVVGVRRATPTADEYGQSTEVSPKPPSNAR